MEVIPLLSLFGRRKADERMGWASDLEDLIHGQMKSLLSYDEIANQILVGGVRTRFGLQCTGGLMYFIVNWAFIRGPDCHFV